MTNQDPYHKEKIVYMEMNVHIQVQNRPSLGPHTPLAPQIFRTARRVGELTKNASHELELCRMHRGTPSVVYNARIVHLNTQNVELHGNGAQGILMLIQNNTAPPNATTDITRPKKKTNKCVGSVRRVRPLFDTLTCKVFCITCDRYKASCSHSIDVEKIPWKSEHMILVLVFMLILYCTRGICSGVIGLVDCMDRCIPKDLCLFPGCSGYYVGVKVLDLYIGMHPLLLILIYMSVQKYTPPHTSTVIFPTLQLQNISAMELDLRQSNVREVDYLVCVMPFALSMALSYMLLYRCFQTNEMQIDDEWVNDTVDSPVVLAYEVLYHVELFFMNSSLILTTNPMQSMQMLLYSTLSLTLILTYFTSCSRMIEVSTLDNQIGVFVLVLLAIVLFPLIISFHTCLLSLCAGIVFLFCVCGVALGHLSTFGTARVKHIIVLRLSISVIASLVVMIVLVVGRDIVCD